MISTNIKFSSLSACPVGYFGQDCSETCINSYTCDGCNDTGGSCDYGCRPGWIVYFCQKSKDYLFTYFDFIHEMITGY